jgi:AraC family ethanolamine operon transcriptional activator
MPIAISRTTFDDFEALQDVVQDNKSDVMQLGAGHMTGSITHLSLSPAFGIATGKFSRSMRATGVLSDTRWCLGLMLDTNGPALGHGGQFGAGDLATAAPGTERYIRCQNNTEYAAALIDPQELQDFLEPQPGVYELLLARHRLSILHVAPAVAANNVRRLRPLVAALIDHGPAMADGTAEFYKRNIMELLTASVGDRSNRNMRHVYSQERLVRGIDRYLTDADQARPIHISELCQHFAVHQRALHRAFDEVVGTPPISYLRMRRLNTVHTALRQAGRDVTVRDVARAHGFLELGRFAAVYHRMFGELPSQTLRRNAHVTLATLFILCSPIITENSDRFIPPRRSTVCESVYHRTNNRSRLIKTVAGQRVPYGL